MEETIASRFADESVRIDHLIWIPGMIADVEAMADVFSDEFCEYMSEDENAQIYQALPCLIRFRPEESRDPYWIADALLLARCGGFLFQVTTPIREYHPPKFTSCYLGWGWVTYEWLYAESIQDVGRLALEWAEARNEEDRQKAMKKAGVAQPRAEGVGS